jgi:hypothetical protein
MPGEPLFAIPTCRLRDVGAAVEAYDQHFVRHGHALTMTVFDDSGPALRDRYFSRLSRIETKNELYYVGHGEKAALKERLCEKLRDRKLSALVAGLFRPSYGGNRNFTLLYSLGRVLVSADDDMRPYALVEDDGRDLGADEICRGKVVPFDDAPREHRSFDIVGSFLDVLGKTAETIPDAYARGDFLVDTAMDLETNTTRGFVRDNSLLLQHGYVDGGAVVKMAQTFRSGTNDIDALDFLDMFLTNEDQTNLDALSEVYVLGRFRPAVTNKNWRMDCGVAAYDNALGLPPFFPTRLRFEDYIYRLWVQQPGVVAAHVPAAQNHTKSAYMRNPPASEIWNEEVANLLKRKIRSSLTAVGPLSVSFDYDGEVDAEDSDRILEKMLGLRRRVATAAESCKNARRVEELMRFAFTLESVFSGFERDLFHYNLTRTLRDTVTTIKSSLELWPALLEICDADARHDQLPRTRIGAGN